MDGDDDTFRDLIEGAVQERFDGWDFAVFDGRYEESPPPWDYRAEVRRLLARSTSLLDMGTGGGELLAEFASDLPQRAVATEGYEPNVPIARRRLEPLGVQVVEVEDGGARLPLADASFDLVINRHEEFAPEEVRRVLEPEGVFLSQQVGGRDLYDLNESLGAPPGPYVDWDLGTARQQLESAGLEILRAEEATSPAWFYDIGAVVLFLRIAPWQVPGFSVERYRGELHRLHARIEREGRVEVSCHRFLLSARRGT